MKGLVTLLIVSLAFTSEAQDTWGQKDTVNGSPRSVSSTFVMNDRGWIVAGLDDNGFRRRMYSYEYLQDDWDIMSSLGGENGAGLNRGSACAFSVGYKAYVCLGQGETNGFFQDCWEYDLITNAWTQKADFAGGPRRQAVSFMIDGIAYVGTGYSPTGLKRDMYSYDPSSNQWTQLNDFGGTARKEAVGFTMGDQGYVGTGDDGVMRKDFWQYEPTTDTWVQKPDFPGMARKGAVGWGQFPSAFICTGEDITFNYTKDLWEFNYYTDQWVQRADFPGPGRSNAVAFVLNGQGYVATGYNGQFLGDMYAYTRIVSMDEHELISNVTIYPNPSKDEIKIYFEGMGEQVKVYALSGVDVSDQVGISIDTKGVSVNRKELSSGIYLIRIKTAENKLAQQRIIFE